MGAQCGSECYSYSEPGEAKVYRMELGEGAICADWVGKGSKDNWTPMPVTVLEVVEADRVDPWARPSKMLHGGRNLSEGAQRHKVVADSMGPEVVLQCSRTTGPSQSPTSRRFSCCLSVGTPREAVDEPQWVAADREPVPVRAATANDVCKQENRAGTPVGLAGMAARRRGCDSDDDTSSDRGLDGEYELEPIPGRSVSQLRALCSRHSEPHRIPSVEMGGAEALAVSAAPDRPVARSRAADESPDFCDRPYI
mmetsp:Transcript_83078/g.220423  ORF Transcript_83078/g.220423 Transcript_83078/m.220423 type:complete len:253 (-) Transcript_83078:100-858(-)